MSDPMTPEVREWMKRTDTEPPDAQGSARQVMAGLPEVRQRRRWWPFPVFYRNTQTSSTTDTSEPQSTPIPALNQVGPSERARIQRGDTTVNLATFAAAPEPYFSITAWAAAFGQFAALRAIAVPADAPHMLVHLTNVMQAHHHAQVLRLTPAWRRYDEAVRATFPSGSGWSAPDPMLWITTVMSAPARSATHASSDSMPPIAKNPSS